MQKNDVFTATITDMNILVWLEGTDRECDISMSEGRIDANICFAITQM